MLTDAYGVAWRVCAKCFAGDGRIYIAPDAERPGGKLTSNLSFACDFQLFFDRLRVITELELRLGARQELMSQFELMKRETENKRLEQKRKLRDLANLRKKMAGVPAKDVSRQSFLDQSSDGCLGYL